MALGRYLGTFRTRAKSRRALSCLWYLGRELYKSGRQIGAFDLRYMPDSGSNADIAGGLSWAKNRRTLAR